MTVPIMKKTPLTHINTPSIIENYKFEDITKFPLS